MKLFKSFIIVLIFFFSKELRAQEPSTAYSLSKDSYDVLAYMGGGFKKQWTSSYNLVHTAVFIPLIWHGFDQDDRYAAYFASKESHQYQKWVSNSAIFMNFPFFGLGMYFYGRHQDDNRLIEFSKETVAATYLAAVQTSFISYFDVNNRPTKENATFWETAFRGKSSFPSGHVLPYTVLTLKTFQFFGPWYALAIPLPLAIITAYERLQSNKHYMSDVLGGIFAGVFASEGVRRAANFQENNSTFQWLYKNEVSFFPYIGQGRYALLFSIAY